MRLEETKIYAIDSFPVELCNITREKRCKLWNDNKLKGYNASKKRYFYGFKVHMVITTNKEPVSCYISGGSVHDVNIAYKILPTLPKNSIAIGDKGYVSNKLKEFLKQFGINLFPIFRNNMKIDKNYLIKRKNRKKIETVFSMITFNFGKFIKATSIKGFLTKLKLFIVAYSIDCFLKLDDKHKNIFI